MVSCKKEPSGTHLIRVNAVLGSDLRKKFFVSKNFQDHSGLEVSVIIFLMHNPTLKTPLSSV
jgi:hypothetical protein